MRKAADALDRQALRSMTSVLDPIPWDEPWRDQVMEATRWYEHLDNARLFPEPQNGRIVREHIGPGPSGTQLFDLRGESAYRPTVDNHRVHHARQLANQTWHARLWTHGTSANHTVVALHGWRAGAYWMTETMLPVSSLLAAGFDVVAPVLPLHGPRALGPSGAGILGANVVRTAETLAQAVWDVRATVNEVVTMGAANISVMGISLGGLVAGLWGAIEPRLTALVAVSPAASLGALLWEHATPTERRRAQQRGMDAAWCEAALWRVSPLAYPLACGGGRALVISGDADAITPACHAKRLADHWGAHYVPVLGGHIAQWQRSHIHVTIQKHLAEQPGIVWHS